jgi:hypothetical protein
MSLHNLQKELVERKELLTSIINTKSISLKSAPQGNLRILKRKNHYQYYLRKDPKDTNGVYIPKKDIKIAASVLQRDYDKKIIEIASRELSKIEEYLALLSNNSIEIIIDNFSESRKRLIEPVFMSDEEYIREWISKPYEHMNFDEDSDEFYSTSGTRVRSKSEVIIANMLEQYNIPYKYEYPIILNGNHLARPDFTCLNIKTRQLLIWEHLGMMDNPDYADRNIRKLSLYEKSGYIVGKNMIVTFESSHVPPTSNIIRSTIENFLL